MMINELVKTNKEWLPGGMVDAVDSKSTDRKVVRVRVSGEPPTLYRLKIFNLDGTQDESAKTFIGRYLNIKNKGEPGLGERVKTNSLIQSDLFFLKRHLPNFFIMKKKSFSFQAT